MSAHGFTLVELLIAVLISLLVSAGALALAGIARTAFTVEPATMETVRRLREGADALTAAVASAGGDRAIGEDALALSGSLPPVRLLITAGAFSGMSVTRAVQGGRGRLSVDQPGPADSLTLHMTDGLCPRSGDVCGFSVGDVASVFDARGHSDVFVVAAVSATLGRITPRAPLAFAYATGAWVVAVRHEQFVLVAQPDGSQTLTRVTAAGAREPLVDGVAGLALQAWGEPAPPQLLDGVDVPGFAQYGLPPPPADEIDPERIFADGAHCLVSRSAAGVASTLLAHAPAEDGLMRLSAADFEDGPWCPHPDAVNRFDADWYRLRRVDLQLRVEVMSAEHRGVAGLLFVRDGTATHDAPRWVRDRGIRTSVAVGR